jgi:ClpP class serine protease
MQNLTKNAENPSQQTISMSINLQELANENKPKDNLDMLKKLQEFRKSKLIVLYLVGGELSPLHFNLIPVLFEILNKIGKSDRIDLLLRSTGGIAEVPWRIVSLIREYCETFGVIVPEIALSGATHIAIAADELILSELSTLGSVDPTRNHPLLPKDKNQNPIPISVQDLKHCILFIKEQLGIKEEIKEEEKKDLSDIISELFKHVHPLSVGAIEQSYQLSRLITRKVLKTRKEKLDQNHIDKIENILGEQYFSHSFPICRKDVEVDLELPVIKASSELHEKIWDLHNYYMNEFNKSKILTQQNQPPISFRYIGFIDSIFTRKALCAIIDPNNQPILRGLVTI